MSLSKCLKIVRASVREHGQYATADRIGITNSTLSRLLHGAGTADGGKVYEPTLEKLEAYAARDGKPLKAKPAKEKPGKAKRKASKQKAGRTAPKTTAKVKELPKAARRAKAKVEVDPKAKAKAKRKMKVEASATPTDETPAPTPTP
jgi:transcriptional regulator with XRE-family HTH domain